MNRRIQGRIGPNVPESIVVRTEAGRSVGFRTAIRSNVPDPFVVGAEPGQGIWLVGAGVSCCHVCCFSLIGDPLVLPAWAVALA